MTKFITLFTLISLFCFYGCAPLFVGGMGAGIMMSNDRRSTATILEDKTIELKGSKLLSDKFKDQAKLKISSFNRFVLVTGQVAKAEFKEEATYILLELPTIRNIQNEIIISGDKSLLSNTNDILLATKVKSILLKNKNVSSLRFKITTFNGSVYLMGLVTKQESDYAANIISKIKGVEKVVKVFEYID